MPGSGSGGHGRLWIRGHENPTALRQSRQAIGLPVYDTDDDIPDGGHANAFVISKMAYRSTPTRWKKSVSVSLSGKRRGPRVNLAGCLIGECDESGILSAAMCRTPNEAVYGIANGGFLKVMRLQIVLLARGKSTPVGISLNTRHRRYAAIGLRR